MPAVQRNFQNFLYVDNNSVNWTKRGEIGNAATAVDGHATRDGSPTWIDSRRMRVRRILYQDPTTFRTVAPIFYTASAWTSVALGDIIAVSVEGETSTVNYEAIRKLDEKQPGRGATRQLADHA